MVYLVSKVQTKNFNEAEFKRADSFLISTLTQFQ